MATMQDPSFFFILEGDVEIALICMESCLALIAIHDHEYRYKQNS